MIIDISEYVLALMRELDASRSESAHAIVENIFLSYAEGTHIVCVGPASVAALRGSALFEKLGAQAKSAMARAGSKYSETKGLIMVAAVYATVSMDDKFVLSHPPGGCAMCIGIPDRFFLSLKRCTLTELITEGVNDGTYFRRLAQGSMPSSAIKVQLEEISAGGSGLAKELEKRRTSDKLVICIADSDKKFPGDRLGETAKQADDKASEFGAELCFRILECRTVENTLSPQAYLNLLGRVKHTGELQAAVRALARCTNDDSTIWRHIDAKHGIVRRSVGALAKRPNCPAEFVRRLVSPFPQSCAETSDGSVACSSAAACKCTCVQGLGANIMVRVNEILQSMSPRDVRALLKEEPELEQLSRLVGFFGCGSAPIIA